VAVLLLEPLETHEVAHFAPRFLGETTEVGDELSRIRIDGPFGLAEELAHLQIEDLEDLEQRVEPDLVLSLLHPREVGLRHADLFGELGLGEMPSLAQLPDSRAHEVNFAGRVRSRHIPE